MSLPSGKIPIDFLKEVVLKNLGAKRSEVAIGPTAGIDSAVIDLDDKSLITSMDPVTGAVERIGWLAVNVNANDVATFGVQPAFLLSCILLPEGSSRKNVGTISTQMDKAAKALGIAIVGGHCEITPGLSNTIVVGCAMGITEKGKYVTAAGAKAKDQLILTKTAGLEGTAILASDRRDELSKNFDLEVLETASKLFEEISIVKDAMIAYAAGGVHAMHDPTEGGILGAVHEIADASDLGVRVNIKKIPISVETKKISEFFNIDPLRLIASGSLLIVAKPDKATVIMNALKKNNIKASIIGEFLSSKDRLMLTEDGKTEHLPRQASDHLWTALAKHG